MPFALTGFGLILVITGINNTYGALGAQLKKDFTGTQSFSVWLLALGSVGALGYVPQLRTLSHYFLALVLISMILSNRGFFQKFIEQFNAGPLAPNAPAAGQTAGNSPASSFGVYTPPADVVPAPGDLGRNYIDKYRPCRLFPSLIGPC